MSRNLPPRRRRRAEIDHHRQQHIAALAALGRGLVKRGKGWATPFFFTFPRGV